MNLERVAADSSNPEFATHTAKVVYLPGGELVPTPQTLFIYWCYKALGRVGEPYETQFETSLTNSKSLENSDFIVLPVSDSKDLRGYLHSLVDQIETTSLETLGDHARGKVKRLHTLSEYLIHCIDRNSRTAIENMQSLKLPTDTYGFLQGAAVNHLDDIPSMFDAGINFIDYLLNTPDADPRMLGKDSQHTEYKDWLLELTTQQITTLECELAQQMNMVHEGPEVIIPINLIDQTLFVRRNLGRLKLLHNEKIGFGVVGPPNSGKSTIVANLVYVMREQLVRFQGYQYGNGINCEVIDFDASTPDSNKILEEGEFGKYESGQKTKWTNEIANSLAREFLTKDRGIFIVNMPGGKPDAITDTLLLPLDSVMLIIGAADDQSWQDKRQLWGTALKQTGLKPAFLVRSRLEGEVTRTRQQIATSETTSLSWAAISGFGKHDWIERIGGRVVGLNRALVADNEFIAAASKLLLLDILPGIAVRRKIAKLKYLKALQLNFS